MKRVPVVALAALALASPAAAELPFIESGSSIGEGAPLKAYATVSPAVHLFGDKVTARLAIVADTKWVVPERLRVRTRFTPYRPLRRPSVSRIQIGRFAQITWTWTLQCITSPCAPRIPPSERYRDFRFEPIRIDYLRPGGARQYGITATWPTVEVETQVAPGVRTYLQATKRFKWKFHTAPVAAPDYRVAPSLLSWLALGLAALAGAGALALGARWYLAVRPRRLPAVGETPTASTLERALALLQYAHAKGDETLERKVLERVADEVEADELTRRARELAWSQRAPEDEDVETLAERARERAE